MNKPAFYFCALLATCAAAAQQQQPADESLQAKAADTELRVAPSIIATKPNEITTVRLTYSGIVVEMVKTKNPLQLINPAAPPEYGSGEDNLLRDPFERKPSGLNLLTIKF